MKNSYVKEVSHNQLDWADSHHNSLEFTSQGVIHRKGSTQLIKDVNVVIPLSMTRGSLIVKPNKWDEDALESALNSCSHGAGRLYSRTDTLKFWHSVKKSEKEKYYKQFPEHINNNGTFDSSLIQEFDFAYKNSGDILNTQPYLIKIDETKPIATVKFTI